MKDIRFEVIEGDNIDVCRDLCNELMAFQKSKATINPELFDMMNFDTRMKVSFQGAYKRQVIVAMDGDKAIGYVFSTIDDVPLEARGVFPAWVPKNDGAIGFYPEWVELPQKIGCLSNIYIREEYKGQGVGTKLCDMAVEWLGSFSESKLSFVFISNGNHKALDFYKNKGFTYSHQVFGGFIEACFMKFE